VGLSDNAGDTPLHLAVWRGNKECAVLLMEYGADVEATNAIGHTPYSNVLVLRDSRKLDETLAFLEDYIGVDREEVFDELEQIFPEMQSKRHLILGRRGSQQLPNEYIKGTSETVGLQTAKLSNYEQGYSFATSSHQHVEEPSGTEYERHEHFKTQKHDESINSLNPVVNQPGSVPFVTYSPEMTTRKGSSKKQGRRYANIDLSQSTSSLSEYSAEDNSAAASFWGRMKQTVGGMFFSSDDHQEISTENEDSVLHKPPTDTELAQNSNYRHHFFRDTSVFLEPPDDVKQALESFRKSNVDSPQQMSLRNLEPPEDVVLALQKARWDSGKHKSSPFGNIKPS